MRTDKRLIRAVLEKVESLRKNQHVHSQLPPQLGITASLQRGKHQNFHFSHRPGLMELNRKSVNQAGILEASHLTLLPSVYAA